MPEDWEQFGAQQRRTKRLLRERVVYQSQGTYKQNVEASTSLYKGGKKVVKANIDLLC